MAKIICEIDTEACTMAVSKDGCMIDHDEFVLGSYFSGHPMDGGSPGSYFPSQWSYFSYSKKSEDGSVKDKIHGIFEVGKSGSYKETQSQHNLARSCADENKRVITAMDMGKILKNVGKKPIIDRGGKVGVPKINPKHGGIETKPDTGKPKI